MNKVMLVGNVASAEVKKVENATVLNFVVATNRKYKNKDGQMVEEAEFTKCVAFGKIVDAIGSYVTVGKQVAVEGRLRTKSWDDKDGTKKYMTEVVIEEISLGSGGSKEGENKSKKEIKTTEKPDEEMPF